MTKKIILVAVGFLACLSATASEKSSSWELMGVRLGMSEADVKATMPSATCEAFADGTTSLCFDKQRALAGSPAELMVKLLDGQVVYVAVEKISIKQGLAGVDALAIKYGAPDTTVKVRANLHGADNDCGRCLYPSSAWIDGNIELFLNVDDWYSKSKDYNYSAIILQDTPVHNGKWVPKYNNKPAATEL